MLSTKDNALLTRVGPGMPMGQRFRRFGFPARPVAAAVDGAEPC